MPRRRPNPKKKSARKQREADNAWLGTDIGQGFLGMLDLQQCCPELTLDAMRRRVKVEESTNSLCIDLSGCSMTALPASIGWWKRTPNPLIELNLSACTRLTALPDEICELKTLEKLGLIKCSSLVALPDSIGELSALRRLELSMCSSLAALPDSIGELKTLNYLNMAKCVKICFLPYAIGGLEALWGLSLVDCTSLSALPDSIDELGALRALHLGGCSGLVLSRDALNGLGALQELHLWGCVKIDKLHLDGLTNLAFLDATSVNLGLGKRDILALHELRVMVQGFSVRKMMRELRDQAKRRRQRRKCDFCGRQGGIDEPRLPICYCGERRYCDVTCQHLDWGKRHSKTCRLGCLTALQREWLRNAERVRSRELIDEEAYRAFRDRVISWTPAEAQEFIQVEAAMWPSR